MFNDPNTYSILATGLLEEDNYTISYSLTGNPETEGWVSFHDHLADYSICLRNERFIQFFGGDLYEHNIGLKGVFFNKVYNSIITPVFSPKLKDQEKGLYPFVIKNINWNTDVEDNKTRKLQETWTSISLHNSFQGTRQIQLKVFKEECSLLEQYGEFNVKRIKNRWYFNYAFNDKDSIYDRTYVEIKDKFLPINTEEKDCIQEELYRTKMFDEYVILRLLFANNTNRKLSQYEINLDVLISTQ